MRIVAGKYRRRKLLSPPGEGTRPIPDRVKESLFERLQDDITDKRVADIFAGTGTIGLEALSRGASGVVFFEKDKPTIQRLRQNVEMLDVAEQTLCWQVDVLRTSFRPRGADHLLPFDTLFFDPPYRMVQGIHPGAPLYRSLERLAGDDVSSTGALLVLRTPRRAKFQLPPRWRFDRTLNLSSMEVHLYEKQARDPAESTAETDGDDGET